ncbi:hypothetical protein L1987_64532 [Smallanthus sonchifolius]|uniref:Uncharacterized protein n=1 Tax=Smallanthus sonchifolius TaxID=185202 RepID=A0ACB9BRZ4_9ASTR|nr:hypothetical protein L1987_64532 [Smallanthus sonchifolius]
MDEKQDLRIKTDAYIVNKEQSSIPGSSVFASESVSLLGSAMDKNGESPIACQSNIPPTELPSSAGKSWSAESLASTGKKTGSLAGVVNEAEIFPTPAPLFSSSFKAKVKESMGRGVDIGPADGLGMNSDGPVAPDGGSSFSAECVEPTHMGLRAEHMETNIIEPMQKPIHETEPTRIIMDDTVLDRNPWVVEPIAEPRVKPRVVDPVCVDPQIARTKGKGIMEVGIIKVTKKKKKNNGPKPRVQIPSLHVSKPGPSKPLGRARPKVITRVTVSNPFEALDDVNLIDDGFSKLNATLKKFAMRYVKEKTIPDPDVFKTWSTDLKDMSFGILPSGDNERGEMSDSHYSKGPESFGPASSNLPLELEVVYPPTSHSHSRVTKRSVSYQWKPPLCSHCVSFGHSLHQCKHNPNPAVDVVNSTTSGNPPQNGNILGSDVPITPSSTPNASVSSVGEDGFTMVSRHKKRAPFKLQSKKPKPVRVKMPPQQSGHGGIRSSFDPNSVGDSQKGGTPVVKQHVTHGEGIKEPIVATSAPKKVTSGFNYSRAVQGGLGSKGQQGELTNRVAKSTATSVSTNKPARLASRAGPSKHPSEVNYASANRFSVLDIPSSIKFSKLVEVQDGLYPPDTGVADSMDLEVNTLNKNGMADYLSIGNYGISDNQKQVILNCLSDFNYVQAEAVEQWSQGEWDFFADKCMEMGLDPENSIIYPDEDTIIDDVEDCDGFESAHTVAHLKKLGSYADPVVSKAPIRK